MTTPRPSKQQVLDIDVDQIFPDPSQPRKSLPAEEFERMRASVAARGLLSPIRVRWDEKRRAWVIISGETRWTAAKLAGLLQVPCLPTEGELSETDILADQITENVVRNALLPLELARALAKLKALTKSTSQELAASLGMTGASVCRAEALLTLPHDIQAMVDDGRVPAASAYELSRLPDAQTQRELAQAIASKRLSRDQAAQAVRTAVGKRAAATKPGRWTCKVAGTGLTVTLTLPGDKEVTATDLSSAAAQLKRAAKELEGEAKPATALADSSGSTD